MADGTGRWQEQPKCRHFAIRHVSFAMLNPCVICHAEPNSPAASLELAPPSDLYDALGKALSTSDPGGHPRLVPARLPVCNSWVNRCKMVNRALRPPFPPRARAHRCVAGGVAGSGSFALCACRPEVAHVGRMGEREARVCRPSKRRNRSPSIGCGAAAHRGVEEEGSIQRDKTYHVAVWHWSNRPRLATETRVALVDVLHRHKPTRTPWTPDKVVEDLQRTA